MSTAPRTIGTAALWVELEEQEGGGRLCGPFSAYEIRFVSIDWLRVNARDLPQWHMTLAGDEDDSTPPYEVLGNWFVLDACTADRAEDAVRRFGEQGRTKALAFEIEDESDRYAITSLSETEPVDLAVAASSDGRAEGRLSISGVGEYRVTFVTPEALVAAAEAGVAANGFFFVGNVFVLADPTPSTMQAVATHLVRSDMVTNLVPQEHEYGQDIVLSPRKNSGGAKGRARNGDG